MGRSSQFTFRFPLILLCLGNLAALMMRVGPWQDAMGLGTTAYDPGISLVGYIGMAFWIGAPRSDVARKAMFAAAIWGIVGGLVLAGEAVLASQPAPVGAPEPMQAEYALMALAAVVWGIVAVRTARVGLPVGMAVLCAAWAAMVSAQFPCFIYLMGHRFALSPGQTVDPYKEFQGIAIGSDATQALVHSLITATGFLLIAHIVACAVGLLCFGIFKPKPKPMPATK